MHASAVRVLEPGNAGAPRGGPGSGGQLERLAGRRRAVGDQMHHRSAHGRIAEERFDVPGLLGHHHDALPARAPGSGIADAERLALERGASGRADGAFRRAVAPPQLVLRAGLERARKRRMPPRFVSAVGVPIPKPLPRPGLMSFRMKVPAAVPSLVQTSSPADKSDNAGISTSPLPAMRPARLPTRRPSGTGCTPRVCTGAGGRATASMAARAKPYAFPRPTGRSSFSRSARAMR
jgi:hypothetical protein